MWRPSKFRLSSRVQAARSDGAADGGQAVAHTVGAVQHLGTRQDLCYSRNNRHSALERTSVNFTAVYQQYSCSCGVFVEALAFPCFARQYLRLHRIFWEETFLYWRIVSPFFPPPVSLSPSLLLFLSVHSLHLQLATCSTLPLSLPRPFSSHTCAPFLFTYLCNPALPFPFSFPVVVAVWSYTSLYRLRVKVTVLCFPVSLAREGDRAVLPCLSLCLICPSCFWSLPVACACPCALSVVNCFPCFSCLFSCCRHVSLSLLALSPSPSLPLSLFVHSLQLQFVVVLCPPTCAVQLSVSLSLLQLWLLNFLCNLRCE